MPEVYVNEQLGLLVELQTLDAAIISIHKHIDTLPLKNSGSQNALNTANSSYEAFRTSLLALEKKKKDKESSIEDINMKIKKLKGKAAEIKTNKEYQAFIKEIENMEKELSAVEDDLLYIMESVDEQCKIAEVEKAKVSEEEKRLKELRDKNEIEKSKAEEELKILMKKRSALTGKIEKDIYKMYVKILKSSGGQAVVQVINEICQGCNLHIPPQQYVEIKSNKEITSCPQCRRILYYNKPAEAAVLAE